MQVGRETAVREDAWVLPASCSDSPRQQFALNENGEIRAVLDPKKCLTVGTEAHEAGHPGAERAVVSARRDDQHLQRGGRQSPEMASPPRRRLILPDIRTMEREDDEHYATRRRVAAQMAALRTATVAVAATLEQASPERSMGQGRQPAPRSPASSSRAEGLVVVDATCRSEGTAVWLKGELKKRFKQPVKYVVLSHDHEDHICNLDVFDDTATTVSHVKAREAVVREKRNTSVPDITFDDQLSLWLGGREIKLLHFGPTHSDNLIQVYVPDEKS